MDQVELCVAGLHGDRWHKTGLWLPESGGFKLKSAEKEEAAAAATVVSAEGLPAYTHTHTYTNIWTDR